MTVLKHNNYSVDAVYDGAILDIMMPKMDSLTVLKTIRLHGNPVPVLLLTAKSEIDDRSTYQLSRKTDSIRLANKEYQMLEMLMINPGQIISTEQFMDKIWGYDSDAELNVVWVYISYLRKKLSSLDSTIQIKATRGLGYQVKRLASLTEKLVMLSRMDEENTTLERQNFCISDAVYDTAEPFLSVAKSKGKTFDIDVTGDIYYTGDEKYIRQLISLLLDNAMKYSSENGIIKLLFWRIY